MHQITSSFSVKKKGLTLFEVLIAIFVFGIGILGVLQVMTQNIGLVDRTKLKANATLITKEAMELTYHHRNTNVLLSYHRSCAEREGIANTDFGCDELLLSGSNGDATYTIEIDREGTYKLTPVSLTGGFHDVRNATRLYRHSYETDNTYTERFDHNETDGKETFYARYLEFDTVSSPALTDNIESKVLRVTANTLYKKGNLTGLVSYETILGERE